MSPAATNPLPLASFTRPVRAAVIGASGGIGGALVAQLLEDPGVAEVFALARRPEKTDPRAHGLALDLTDEASIAAAARAIQARCGRLDLVVVASGMLHQGDTIRPEKSWRALDGAAFEAVLRVNTIGPALVAKHMLELLPGTGKAVFAAVSARVGSIGDNRLGGWHAYRASKAALNMVLRGLAIELARRRPEAICAALHPGTVETALSAPFAGNVPGEQLATPQEAAANLLAVIDGLGAQDSGGFFAWDGRPIPF